MFFTLIKSARNRFRFLITLLFFLVIYSPAIGQLQQASRYELPLEPGSESFKVISAQDNGLVAYRNVSSREGPLIELVRLDTALQQIWRGYISTDWDLVLHQIQTRKDFLYMLMKSRKYETGDFIIVKVELSTGKYGTHFVRNFIPFVPTQLNLTDEAALIGGYFNYRPLIVYYHFAQKQSKVLPGFLNEPGELSQVRTNADGSIDIVVSGRNFEKKYCLWLRNYDSQGSLLKTIVLTPDQKKSLIFGSSLKGAGDEQVVSGVYGRHSDYSRGIFVAVVNPMGEYTIRYYNFSELQRFFNYMKAGREKRIRNRIDRRKIQGKKTKFNYRFVMHELLPYNNQFILIGEAFYPHYTYSTGSYRGLNNYNFRSYGSSAGPIFDGYHYTHAVVIGFDQNGKIVWDNSFEINDVKSMKLEQFVKIQPEEDRIVLLYLFDNVLRSKIISGSEVLEGKNAGSIDPSKPIVKSKSRFNQPAYNMDNSKLDHWYGKYFFAYSTQPVRSGNNVNPGDQKVFLINKITYK
jgi:hypothetical protein